MQALGGEPRFLVRETPGVLEIHRDRMGRQVTETRKVSESFRLDGVGGSRAEAREIIRVGKNG